MLGENLLIKMWETLTKEGIGSLASPWQIKREGKAHAEVRREEMLLLAQTEIEVDQIKQGKKRLLADGRLISIPDFSDHVDVCFDSKVRIEPNLDLDSISKKVSRQNKAVEIQREINLNRTILYTEEELLKSNQEPIDRDIDPDWVTRWRENAENTKGDELRRFWAKILAGEVKSPGTYSLRTMEFIKNLSQHEAEAISKLGQLTDGTTIFKCKRLDELGMNFSFLLSMEELGIITGVQGGDISGISIQIYNRESSKYSSVIVNRNLILLIEAIDQHKKLELPCYPLTKIGVEILSLGDFKADGKYMHELGTMIKEKGFNVKIANWIPGQNGYGQYTNALPL